MENDINFWRELEKKDSKILKWNTKGKYDRIFTPNEKIFLNYLQDLPDIPIISIGQIITGKISSITKKEIIIDINYKDSIYININAGDYKLVKNLEINDTIDVIITSINENPYEITGSITELIKLGVVNKLRQYYKENLTLNAKITEIIPAGFVLDIEMDNITINAFMPNTLAGVNRLTIEQSQDLIGKTIKVQLETLQQEKGVYVVSRKKYLNSLIPKEITKLKKGVVYTGLVTGSKPFGVFVEFKGEGEETCLTGMIHKVNLNSEWHDKMDEIKPGFEIDFYIEDVLKGNRIILTQNLIETLWDTIRVGQIKEGIVKAVKPFGALVSLDVKTTGLIQNTYIEKAKKSLNFNDKVTVKVVSVIKNERKIYLSFP